MPGYRPIYKRIWKDPDFQELSPADKLIFIYLFTNEMVTESGIYHITPKTVADETGIDITTVSQRFNNGLATVAQGLNKGSSTVGKPFGKGCFKNIIYDAENKVIFVKKIRRYNTGGQPSLIRKSILNDYHTFYSKILWDMFFIEYPEFRDLPLTVGKPLFNGSDNDNDNDNDIDNKGGSRGELNVYKIYENNIGLMTPVIVEELKDIEKTYPLEWFNEAVKEACLKNARNLKYINAILQRWQTEGFKSKRGISDGELKGHNKRIGDAEGSKSENGGDKYSRSKYAHLYNKQL